MFGTELWGNSTFDGPVKVESTGSGDREENAGHQEKYRESIGHES